MEIKKIALQKSTFHGSAVFTEDPGSDETIIHQVVLATFSLTPHEPYVQVGELVNKDGTDEVVLQEGFSYIEPHALRRSTYVGLEVGEGIKPEYTLTPDPLRRGLWTKLDNVHLEPAWALPLIINQTVE